MSNKKRNKEIRRKYELKKEIENNPDWCYCSVILGIEEDIDYINDIPIGVTKPIDGFPFPESKGYVQDIYICKRCGKKHTQLIGF
jgi:hypothetical protein